MAPHYIIIILLVSLLDIEKSIIREVHMLKDRGVDLISHCHIRVGNGLRTQFWNEVWIGDTQLRVMFPRIYALEINKDCTVADKLQFSVTSSLRRSIRGGVESSQLALLQTYIEGTLLSNMEDRWVWDLNGEVCPSFSDLLFPAFAPPALEFRRTCLPLLIGNGYRLTRIGYKSGYLLKRRNVFVVPGLEVGWIRRIQELDTAYWGFLRIQRIDLYSSMVFGECRHEYAVSSLMDMAYWSPE
ncbi:hypothetical protein Tco_0066948 [Tanacetum coccineum]